MRLIKIIILNSHWFCRLQQRYDSNGAGSFNGPVATVLFATPYALALDAAGNIFVPDGENNRIRGIGH